MSWLEPRLRVNYQITTYLCVLHDGVVCIELLQEPGNLMSFPAKNAGNFYYTVYEVLFGMEFCEI
jgi:hypothetical protein